MTLTVEGAQMATVRLAYVDAYRDRHGRQRFYYRRNGRRFALPGLPGEPEFMAAYEAAAARFVEPSTAKSLAPREGTFNALALAYYGSPSFLSLRPSTQTTYRGIIDRWRKKNGDKRVTHLQRRHVVDFVSEQMKASGPWAANNLLSTLKILMRFAVDNEWCKDDPTLNVRPIRAKSEGFATWSEADISAFEKRWPVGTRERLAFALLLYTGQRRGDVVNLGWQHVRGSTIRVTQSKTGASLAIPLHPQLRSILEGTTRDNLTFIVTAQGKGFTAAGFGNWFREACDAAKLKKRSAHGLRKAAARRLAEAGCSALQIGAITGHKTLKEVSRYTVAADQARLARDAIKRLKK